MGANDKVIAQMLGRPAAAPEDPLWYKDAVIYQVHVKSFFDANNDGVGDFAGLIAKLDYIAGLGVTCVWLLPFYPSPRRDDGYDIAEYRGVHPDYGTMADVRRFVQEAHRRGLRVITELVINHTSDQHPWFQRARLAKPGSAARNFYVWSDNDQAYSGTRIIFLDTEKSNWTWDPVANAFFWHRFYSHQPDLNFDNPLVLKEVLKVMKFWLELGIDGLRLDAVPYLIEREGTSNENLAETHTILKRIRAELDRSFPGRMLLAEANMWPEDVQPYFGDGNECHMAFHFPLMPRMYMALAQEDRFPLTDILRQTPEIPPNCQWSIFLRNHDELTLEMVTNRERDYLWNFYAEDRRARINLGIRRRLAPLLKRDRRRIELLNSFLLSMPGTPVIYYGDEIGMGDNIHLGDRDGVRTPMQWTSDRNAGFSRADPARLVLPPIMDPVYGFQAINVEAQDIDAHSLLNWMRRLLQVRGKHPAFGRGSLRLLYPNNRKVFAYLREYHHPDTGPQTILCVTNVSSTSQAVELDLSEFEGRVPVEMLGGVAFPPIGQLTYLLTLPPYGFNWFVLATNSDLPSWHTPAPEPLPEFATLVLRGGIEELLVSRSRSILENEALPQYLIKRRWYAAKQYGPPSVRIETASRMPAPADVQPGHVLVLAEVSATVAGERSRYLIPVGFVGEDDPVAGLQQQLALARVRRGKEVGFITDAFALDRFAMQMVELMRAQARVPALDGEVRFDPTPALAEAALPAAPEIRRISADQSNSSVVIGDTVVLKVIRKVAEGLHPEAEMGRFLTLNGFANTPAMLGEVSRLGDDGQHYTLMLLQRFLHNQGDGWQWTLNILERAAQPGGLPVLDATGTVTPMNEFEAFVNTLGRRLGEMHSVLARPGSEPAFAPETADAAVLARWGKDAVAQLDAAFKVLQAAHELSAEADAQAKALLAERKALRQAVSRLAAGAAGALAIRIHGDFHLGQVLVSSGDAWIVDFEGEPSKSLAQRRAKASPWRDVAGLLRSFDYAAAFSARGKEGAAAPDARLLDEYHSISAQAFLRAYREHAPADSEMGGESLLKLFMVEKAAYELCYEAANRPAWLEVPLQGLARLAGALLADAPPEVA
ncbi:maltose alpha-D-glucosyltransferase [Polaromonas aquatica]|uniref:maltose alpha-D-glucosyltransferase n=1 Tax=Polaromonas aquatica TaxID=332657 RepID=UPI003D64BA37